MSDLTVPLRIRAETSPVDPHSMRFVLDRDVQDSALASFSDAAAAQVTKGVNARTVAIAEANTYCIIAKAPDPGRHDVLRHSRRIQHRAPAHLIDTGRTAACQT